MSHDETPRGTVRVVINCWRAYWEYHRVADDDTHAYAFDIPAERVQEWDTTRLAWDTLGTTIRELHGARRDTIEAVRDAAELREQYEEAKAAWEAHCAETGETP